MLRNKNSRNDFMGYPEPPVQQVAPVSQLENKDERLLELSEIAGRLDSENKMLNEDNRRLEQENSELRERVQSLNKRNIELERQEAADSAGYKSGSQLVEEIEEALTAKKGTK